MGVYPILRFRKVQVRFRTVFAASLLLVLIVPATALSARAPTSYERKALAAVADAGMEGHCHLQKIVVSTSGPYARGFDACSSPYQSGEDLFTKSHAEWYFVLDLSSMSFPCSVPAPVVADLKFRVLDNALCVNFEHQFSDTLVTASRWQRATSSGVYITDPFTYNLSVKPSTLNLDKYEFAVQLRWRNWGQSSATGQGTDHIHTCYPSDCASGANYVRPVAFTVSRIRSCSGHLQYTNVMRRWSGAPIPGGPSRTQNVALPC